MPWTRIRFREHADNNGQIKTTQQVFLPQSVMLFKFRLQTSTGCKDRKHSAKITIEGKGVRSHLSAVERSVPKIQRWELNSLKVSSNPTAKT